MDLGNLSRINVEFKDMHKSISPERRSAKVILIDRTNPGGPKKCYILKDEAYFSKQQFESYQKGFCSFNEDDFILIGEILSVDKINKYVTLKDENTISYNHLIIAFSTHYSLISYEFIAGVNTLVDAIRVRKKIPSAFAVIDKNSTTASKKMKSSKISNLLNKPKRIENIKRRKLVPSEDCSYTLNNSTKRLYEVQV